ncbi:GNAT family N-acetyltransferase [Nicoliella spurrieriana]|uniref:GNAT family N-acetyltransferase n=1 Tax=Nicoliella spurrieriana TaxID=2925830 RepID=A0A976X5S7_9LACO|nr:GNAT family N-acetyltransferase [Nicoliella spurrieriana]UQS87253.1 GNAT family N-acetyltransferase [Nicoliella spurrieriana]
MEITFRPPTQNDLDGMLHVEQSCFEPEERMDENEFIQVLKHVSETTIIAADDDHVAGMLIGRTTSNQLLDNDAYHLDLDSKPGDKYLAILGLAVYPDYQGHGIATQLLDQIEKLAKQRGLSGVTLDCREHLIPFYEKHGFELLGRSNSNFGGIEWFGMQKNI